MIYQRKFSPEAKQLIKKLAPQAKSSIRALTDKLLTNPYIGKALRKELAGYYSVRHERYRAIYEISEKNRWIVIVYIGLRKNIYDVFSAFLKKAKKS